MLFLKMNFFKNYSETIRVNISFSMKMATLYRSIYMYQRSRNLSYFKILTSSKKWTFLLENDPFRIFPPPFCILHHCTFHLTPKLGYNTQNTACTINCLVNLLRTDIPLQSWSLTVMVACYSFPWNMTT